MAVFNQTFNNNGTGAQQTFTSVGDGFCHSVTVRTPTRKVTYEVRTLINGVVTNTVEQDVPLIVRFEDRNVTFIEAHLNPDGTIATDLDGGNED